MMNTNYRIARIGVPVNTQGGLQQAKTYTATFTVQPQWHPRQVSSGPQYSADQLALIQAGVQNITPATNPSELTPDQLNQLQSFQTMQNITANGGQFSPAQLQSLQAYYQAQALANSPYVSTGVAAPAATGTLSDFISSVPTWGWIAAGVAAIYLMRGRK